jgi:hypothetical protein
MCTKRADDEVLPDLTDSFHTVRPGWKEVPGGGQRCQLAGREGTGIDVVRPQDGVQVLTVKRVEGYVRALTGTDPLLGWLVLRSPGVGEFLGIEGQRVVGREDADSRSYAGPPVDNSAERVEQDCPHRPARRRGRTTGHGNLRFCAGVAPGLRTRSMDVLCRSRHLAEPNRMIFLSLVRPALGLLEPHARQRIAHAALSAGIR